MPGKILVVEDLPDAREILSSQVRQMGYKVLEAANGEEAVEKAVAERPDLIIMDLGLPRLTGIDAASRIKQNPETAAIPIIAYTVWDKEQYRDKAEKAGIAAYLTKPTPPKIMEEVIAKLLRERKPRGRRK